MLFFFLCPLGQAKVDDLAEVIIAADYELVALNFGEYAQSSILTSSPGRTRSVEFKGGKKAMGGFSFEYVFDPENLTKVRLSLRSSLLLGQENSNGGNLTDYPELELDATDSYSGALAFYWHRWVFDALLEKLSIGKVKYLDVSTDLDGNTGQILGTYNLVVDRVQASAHYHFGEFPFHMGLRGYQQKAPRIPHRYMTGVYQESGPLQMITYRSLNVSMELGEGLIAHNFNVPGLKWSMNFSMGLGEYSFEKASGAKDEESSSTFVISGALGYQWLFKLGGQQFFFRTDNRYYIHSFDNNDGNADALTGEVNRTSGNDEEYRALLQLGFRH